MSSSSSSSKQSKPVATYNSLSSIVSNLEAAQWGIPVSSRSKSTTSEYDADMDRRIAELIKKEALEKQKKLNNSGVSAYLDRSTPIPKAKPNTNFLSSMLRSVTDHNTSLIREQEQAAKLANKSRLPDILPSTSSKYSSRSRKGEDDRDDYRPKKRSHAGSGSMRGWSDDDESDVRRASSSHRDRDDGDHRRSRGYDDERRKSSNGKRRYDDSEEGEGRRKNSTSSGQRDRNHEEDQYRSREKEKKKRDDYDSEEEEHRRRRRRREKEEMEDEERHHESRSSLHPSSSTKASKDNMVKLVSLEDEETSHLPQLESKMDKYFKDDYDPRLDVSKPGKDDLVGEGWVNMLEILKEKEEEKRRAKEEKKAAEKQKRREEKRRIRREQKALLDLSSDDDHGKKRSSSITSKSKLRRVANPFGSSGSDSDAHQLKPAKKSTTAEVPAWLKEKSKREDDLMSMEYTKRGNTRAWDKGKNDGAEDKDAWKSFGKDDVYNSDDEDALKFFD